MALTEFPIEATEPKVEVVLPIGTHELELVVVDSMGLKSTPAIVVVTVEQEAAVPAITDIAPSSGEPGDEFKAVISGVDLDGASKVAFLREGGPDGTVTAVIDKVASDRLDVTVSIGSTASPGKRDLTVTTPAGTAVGTGIFTVKAAPAEKPVVEGIDPDSGEQGDKFEATIYGANLENAGKVVFLREGGPDSTIEVSIEETSPEKLLVVVNISPEAPPGERGFTVTTPAGTGESAKPFVVVGAEKLPVVEGIDPDSGEQGDKFEAAIYGANLEGASKVVFLREGGPDGTIEVSIEETSPEKLLVVVNISSGAPPGERGFTVTTPAGTGESAKPFVVKGEPVEKPVVEGIEPDSGEQGDEFEAAIYGANLEDPSEIIFLLGGEPDETIKVDIVETSPEKLVVLVGIHSSAPPGERGFTVTTPAGTGESAKPFVVKGEPVEKPVIKGIDPKSGMQGETLEKVLIAGENLDGATEVRFFIPEAGMRDEGVAADIQNVGSEGIAVTIQIAADAKPGERGFTVITPAGTAQSPAGVTFTVEEVPVSSVIKGIAPTSGEPGENFAVIYGAEPLMVSSADGVIFLLKGEPDKSVTCIQATGGAEGQAILKALLAAGELVLTEEELKAVMNAPAPLVIRIGIDSAAVTGARSFMVGKAKSPAGVTFTVEEGGIGPIRTVEEVSGIGPTSAARLAEAGVTDLGKLAAAKPVFVAETLGISEERALEFVIGAKRLLGVPEVELSGRSVEEVSGIGPAAAARLAEAGVNDLAELAALEPATLAKILETTETRASEFVKEAQRLQG